MERGSVETATTAANMATGWPNVASKMKKCKSTGRRKEEQKGIHGEEKGSSREDGVKGGEKEDMGEVRVKVTRDGMEDNRDGMGVKKEERGLGRREVQKGDCIGSMKVAHHRQSKADGRRKDPGMVKDVCSIWFQSPQDWSSRMPSRT